MTIILATGNSHKIQEVGDILKKCLPHIRVIAPPMGMPPVDENADTFEGNAWLKAEALAANSKEQTYVLADDSGLEVDALEGAPGVYSARYAGEKSSDEDNLNKLLAELKGVSDEKRTARFVCALALMGGDEVKETFSGVCEGKILNEACGGAGFGYDPIFAPSGYEQSFSELGGEIKAKLSHRAIALDALASYLAKRL